LVHDLTFEQGDEPGTDGSEPDPGDAHRDAQASLDQVLREAAEARQPREEGGRGT
jgi:hypothetical protein